MYLIISPFFYTQMKYIILDFCISDCIARKFHLKIALLTNVEEYSSDGEGHHVVRYDDDFSLANNVHELVKQALKIEVQKLDSQAKDRVARAMIARIER